MMVFWWVAGVAMVGALGACVAGILLDLDVFGWSGVVYWALLWVAVAAFAVAIATT